MITTINYFATFVVKVITQASKLQPWWPECLLWSLPTGQPQVSFCSPLASKWMLSLWHRSPLFHFLVLCCFWGSYKIFNVFSCFVSKINLFYYFHNMWTNLWCFLKLWHLEGCESIGGWVSGRWLRGLKICAQTQFFEKLVPKLIFCGGP